MSWTALALRLLVFGAVLYSGLVLVLYLLQDKLIYPAPRGGARAPKDAGLEDGEPIALTAQDGTKLHGWILLPPNRAPGVRVPAFLLFHGNGENVNYDAAWLDLLRQLGAAAVAVDYRGYGLSEGAPSEPALIADALLAYDALAARPDIDPKRIVLLGSSLGSGVATAVAAERTPAALVIQSGFDSLRAVASRHFPYVPSALVRSSFDSASRIGRVRCPVLFFHGDRDNVVPIEHGRALHAKTPNAVAFEVIEGAGHNDVIATAGPRYGAKLLDLIASLR